MFLEHQIKGYRTMRFLYWSYKKPKRLKDGLFLHNLSPHGRWVGISVKAIGILVHLKNKQENILTACLFSHPWMNCSQRLWICKDSTNGQWSNFSKMLSLDTKRMQDLFLFQAGFQRNRFPFAQIKTFIVLERENKHLFGMCWHHCKCKHMVQNHLVSYISVLVTLT